MISNSKIRILIPACRNVVENGKSFTVYCIEVVCDGKVTNVDKRYSEFYDLYRKLSKIMEGKISFPPKRMMNNKDQKLIEARRKNLEIYLQTVLHTFQEEDIPDRLLQFLAIPNYYDDMMVNNGNDYGDVSATDDKIMYTSNNNVQNNNMVSFRKDAYLVPTLKDLEEASVLPDIVMSGCLDGIYGDVP